jgi:hypothetical protein
MLLSRLGEDSLIPPRMGSGTRLQAVGILPLHRREAQRIPGRVAQREAGAARVAKCQETNLGRARSREARRPNGRQIAR